MPLATSAATAHMGGPIGRMRTLNLISKLALVLYEIWVPLSKWFCKGISWLNIAFLVLWLWNDPVLIYLMILQCYSMSVYSIGQPHVPVALMSCCVYGDSITDVSSWWHLKLLAHVLFDNSVAENKPFIHLSPDWEHIPCPAHVAA